MDIYTYVYYRICVIYLLLYEKYGMLQV